MHRSTPSSSSSPPWVFLGECFFPNVKLRWETPLRKVAQVENGHLGPKSTLRIRSVSSLGAPRARPGDHAGRGGRTPIGGNAGGCRGLRGCEEDPGAFGFVPI